MRSKAMLMLVQFLRSSPRNRRVAAAATLSIMISTFALAPAQTSSPAGAGVAWAVRGQWLVDGAGSPVVAGGAIPPGSLLLPQGAPNHSILVLLPDGLRLLFECFTAEDC